MNKAAAKVQPIAVKNNALAGLASLIFKATQHEAIEYRSGTFPHLPTEIIQIDTLIGGELVEDKKSMVCPGLPKGRIIELYGAESSGKTTLGLKFISVVQKNGGTALFLDYEHALHHGYSKATGVNFSPDKLLLYKPNTFEEGIKMLFLACKAKVELVVIDSVSAMVPASELAKKVDDPAKIGALASTMSKYLPKMVKWLDESGTTLVFINQTRALISTSSYAPSGGGEDNTSGGKALKFFCSVRLKTTRIRSDFVEKKDSVTLKKKRIPYGNLVQVKAVKNKMAGHQGHTSEIFIRYGTGVDEYLSLIESAVPRSIIAKSAGNYTYGTNKFVGKEKVRKFLIENPKVYADIRDKVMKAIMSEAPEPIQDDDDIEDDDIISDMRKNMGDDDIADSEDEPSVEETLAELDAS